MVACAGLATASPGATAYADPVLPAEPDPTASQALHAAEDAIAGKGDLDPTLALTDLYAALPDLTGKDRKTAKRILGRPDGTGPLFPGEPRYPSPGAKLCGPHVCVHYATTKTLLGPDHRPPPADADTSGVPDWVETTSSVMEQVWTQEIDQLGYHSAPTDGTAGGDAKVDVYLADVGKQGYYGYAQPEDDADGNAATATAHMVLDNDYADFPAAPIVSLKATAAHEFFHTVQFGYDVDEQPWLMETTATWMEEQVYDSVNDNRNFLEASSLRHPEAPLDSPDVWYGNWVFFEFVSERMGRDTVKELWTRAAGSGVGARTALSRTLTAHGSSLGSTFSQFSAASNAPADFYEEGQFFPRATVARTWTLSKASPATGNQSVTLNHLSSRDYVFVPGSTLTGTWRLKVAVDGPSTGTTAYALVSYANGSLGKLAIALNTSGNGSATLKFSRSSVSKVFLNVGNSDAANGRAVKFHASAVR
jgi:hypothetical protein